MPNFTEKITAWLDVGKGVTMPLLHALWDNTTNVRDRMNTHLHNGADGSAKIEVGPNLLRNPSFEDGTTGWTPTQYTGGTVAISTSNHMNGAKALAITSTVLGNGGGDVVSDEYVPVTEGNAYALFSAIKASVAGVSSKIEMLWYDNAKSQISASTVYSSNSSPTVISDVGGVAIAPSNARWARAKPTGGVPTLGSATGTVYFDGMRLMPADKKFVWDRPGTYTFTMPADIVYVRVQGAGGAGNASGYAGASGAYGEGYVMAPKGTSVTITVGVGGIYPGGIGGTSSFGSYLSCTGGYSGQNAVGGVVTPAAATPVSMGVTFPILLDGVAASGAAYANGATAFLANTGGLYNATRQAKYGGGGYNGALGYGGDGFVAVEW